MKAKLAVIIAAALSLIPFAAPADGHYLSRSYVESLNYARFNYRCGYGSWFCDQRNLGNSCAIVAGYHTRYCVYVYSEFTWYGAHHSCQVNSTWAHDQLAWRNETCG